MEESKPAGYLPNETWSNRRCLVVLLIITAVMRLWQLTHTEVPARDSIGYIRIAWSLENRDWKTTIRQSSQHPGYPVAILAVSKVVGLFYHGDLPMLMQYSAQIASALASLGLVVAMFWLGREFWSKTISFWSALVFVCWPTIGRLLGDGLSESLFLCFCATALLFSARAFRTGQLSAFALAGLAGACAYLTRPEGLLIVGFTGIVLLAQQAFGQHRWTWGRCLTSGVVLTAATCVVALPFMLLIGHVTTKPTARRIMEGEKKALAEPPATHSSATTPLGVWWPGPETATPTDRFGWACGAIVKTLVRGFFHVGWFPLLLAVLVYRHRFREQPGLWVHVLLVGLISALVFRVALQLGYLSSRHLVLLLMCGSFWSVAGTFWLAEVLVQWAKRYPKVEALALDPARVAVGMIVIVASIAAYRTLLPLHDDRQGFKEAGAWLARNTKPGDSILDPYAWSRFYSGRVFSDETRQVARTAPVIYVVYENGKSKHVRIKEIIRAKELIQRGRLRESWNVRRGQVQIYEVPLE